MDTTTSHSITTTSIVECRVEATSNDVASQVWFITPSLTQERLNRLQTIQLRTVSHNESDWEDSNSWFELVIYRSWDLSRPRINLATKKVLAWRSHTTPGSIDDDFNGIETNGTVFKRGDEMFKELEAGDVIAARICVQSQGCVNYGIEGKIIVTLKDKAAPAVPTSYTVYPYSSVGPCYVRSIDHSVTSKIWFSTPPLGKETIDKLSGIQLYTESRDQGWAEDKSGSYSWFELIILESHDSNHPLIQDNYELAWPSHHNKIAVGTNTLLKGHIFDRCSGLLGCLVPGNSIGVRVCTRFRCWRNLAIEGRLELRFSEPVEQEKPVKPGKSQLAVEATYFPQRLSQTLDNMYPLAKSLFEVDRVVADLLAEPMQWGVDYSSSKSPLSILSFDGGGVRGLSSLMILQAIMARVQGPNGEKLNPWQCFDLIGGTSAGGLIALMLGRLRMSAEACLEEYQKFAQNVFSKSFAQRHFPGASAAGNIFANNYKYDEDVLKKAIEQVVDRSEYNKAGPDAQMLDSSTDCRVVVFACYEKNVNNTRAKHFRTYQFENDTSALTTKIWEAARATTAAPTYFKPITLGGVPYIDGGLQVNNPVIQTLAEQMVLFGKARIVGSLLSIGTGLPSDMSMRREEGIFRGQGISNQVQLVKNLTELVTNAQLAHLNVTQLNQDNRLLQEYFRFNAEVNIANASGQHPEYKIIELDDVEFIGEFMQMTAAYLADAGVQAEIQKCADTISALYRQRHDLP